LETESHDAVPERRGRAFKNPPKKMRRSSATGASTGREAAFKGEQAGTHSESHNSPVFSRGLKGGLLAEKRKV